MLQRAQIFFRLAFWLHFLLLRFRVFDMQPFCRDAGVCLAIGNGKLMLVAVAAFNGHLWVALPLALTALPAFRYNNFPYFTETDALLYCKEVKLFMGKGCRRARPTAMERGFMVY